MIGDRTSCKFKYTICINDLSIYRFDPSVIYEITALYRAPLLGYVCSKNRPLVDK